MAVVATVLRNPMTTLSPSLKIICELTCLFSELHGNSIADFASSSEGCKANCADENAVLKAQLKQRDDTIAALRRENSDINWSKNIGMFPPKT